MSAGVAYLSGSIVLAGVIAAVGLMIRKGLRDVAWHHYGVTLSGSVKFGPAPFKAAPSGAALNGHAPARAAEKPAERPAIAPVPEGQTVTRAQLASITGLPVTTLKSAESRLGLERAGTTGPREPVTYTAASVNRYLASLDGGES